MFHVIEDAHAILRSGGVYKQVKLYRRNDGLYAGWGSGFIRLLNHGTSKPNVSVDEIVGVEHVADKLGRLTVAK